MKAPTRRVLLVLYCLLMLLAVQGVAKCSPSAEPLGFRAVASGIEHAAFRVTPADSEPFAGHAFKVDLDVAQLRLVPAGGPSSRQTVEQIAAPFSGFVAVNASFFDKEGRAMGLAANEGNLIARGKLQSWGALVVGDQKSRIVLGAEIGDHHAYRVIVQGIPRLVVGGRVPGLKPQLAERTAVCAEGRIVVLIVSTKAETSAFARFLADPPEKGGLGCVDALNLDGGPSTQLAVNLPGLTLSQRGGWGVPNALVVVPGKR
jgi:Phosphodiester glycosidase